MCLPGFDVHRKRGHADDRDVTGLGIVFEDPHRFSPILVDATPAAVRERTLRNFVAAMRALLGLDIGSSHNLAPFLNFKRNLFAEFLRGIADYTVTKGSH